jgi:hypothetical protein
MAAVLIISDRCKYCIETIEFIKNHPVLIPLVKIHDIKLHGVPDGIKNVPALITPEGTQLLGLEVIRWLEMNVPCSFDGNESKCGLGSNFNEPADDVGDFFPLDAYGIPLGPVITKDLQSKIDRPLTDAFNDIKKSAMK